MPSTAGLNPTSNMVLQLATCLPYQKRTFSVYKDNYYSNIPLFRTLLSMGVGACGTARANSKDFPACLKVTKKEADKLEYHYRLGAVVDGVVTLLWKDNGAVNLMTTIHRLHGRDSEVILLRKRPMQSNPVAARTQFTDEESEKLLNIPACIDDYNKYKEGIDIADQLQCYYNTQQVSNRTCYPLWFFFLETALTMGHIIHRDINPTTSHKDFRLAVAWYLIEGETERRSVNTHPTGSRIYFPNPR